jgi:tetratricopeptide (TPR) repeat protein
LGLDVAGGIDALRAEPATAAPRGPATIVRLDEGRAPVILGGQDGQAAGPAIVDESGLRYYAAQHQTERVQAEIARLRRRYPNWTVPTDLDTLKPSPPEEAPLWDLFTAGRIVELRAAIAARQAVEPEWRPSDDLARKLNRGTLRGEVKAAEQNGDWDSILARANASPSALRDLDIDIAWLVAEAYARTGATAQATAAYRAILESQTETALRLATVQKAMAVLPMAQVETLLTLAHPAADGSGEFQAIRLDVTRARIAAFLHDEPAGRIEPAELAALGEAMRKSGMPDQISLLGWYAYRRRQFREALDWFKMAIARGGDARVATGLALSLRELGQDREAEEIAFAWRGPSVTNTALYMDMMERQLTLSPVAPVDAGRLDRFAKLVLATTSGEGAQALGWYAYNACQFEAAVDWFQRATAWKPQEAAVLGYALTLGRLKRTREFIEVINRYDGLYPTVVELALPQPDTQKPHPCDPVRPGPAAVQTAAAAQARVPKPVPAAAQLRAIPVKRGEFPVAVAAENPLRFPEPTDQGREAEFLREPRGTPPLVARRVPGVGAMPYERYGFTLLPGWNGLDRATPQAAQPVPPAGTLAQSEVASGAFGGGSRTAQARDSDRFGPFDSAAAAPRGASRSETQDR